MQIRGIYDIMPCNDIDFVAAPNAGCNVSVGADDVEPFCCFGIKALPGDRYITAVYAYV